MATAAPCEASAPYPGDESPPATARWMAHHASRAGLPRELPVMGALEESNLHNLPPNDDRAGFFGTRVSIWNTGPYAGFPEQPPLQLRWFTDQASEVRKRRISEGGPDPAADEDHWGEWIADVLLPPAQDRGRYQLRLAQARELVGPPCAATGSPGSPNPSPVVETDVVGPVMRLVVARRQRALRRRAVLVRVTCPVEACTVAASGTVSVPRAARVLRISASPRLTAAGRKATLRLRLKRRVRASLGRALRRRRAVRFRLHVTATDARGNRTVRSRALRIVR